MKRTAFQRKQRALYNALLIGDQIARRNRRELCTAVLTTWQQQTRLSVCVGSMAVARQARQRLLAFQAWRDTAEAHVRSHLA